MNARNELLEALEGRRITWAWIRLGSDYAGSNCKRLFLREGYSSKDYEAFLKELDFDYYEGYGVQELFGEVLLTSNSWLERGEHDGAEWWNLKEPPKWPKEVK